MSSHSYECPLFGSLRGASTQIKHIIDPPIAGMARSTKQHDVTRHDWSQFSEFQHEQPTLQKYVLQLTCRYPTDDSEKSRQCRLNHHVPSQQSLLLFLAGYPLSQ